MNIDYSRKILTCVEDLIGIANELEEKSYIEEAEKLRDLAGRAENVAIDLTYKAIFEKEI